MLDLAGPNHVGRVEEPRRNRAYYGKLPGSGGQARVSRCAPRTALQRTGSVSRTAICREAESVFSLLHTSRQRRASSLLRDCPEVPAGRAPRFHSPESKFPPPSRRDPAPRLGPGQPSARKSLPFACRRNRLSALQVAFDHGPLSRTRTTQLSPRINALPTPLFAPEKRRGFFLSASPRRKVERLPASPRNPLWSQRSSGAPRSRILTTRCGQLLH